MKRILGAMRRGKVLLLALIVALTLGAASTAMGHTGFAGLFHLNHSNAVNAISTLVGSIAGPVLRLDNNSTGTSATALNLQVEPNRPPMTVNSSTKVTNLNSDKLDGLDSSEFMRADAGRAHGLVTDSFIDDFTSADYTPVTFTSFTVPSSGFLHITGTISAEDDCSLANSGWLAYRLRLDSTPVTDAFAAYELDYEDCNNFSSGADTADSGATSAVVSVSEGTHSIYLEAKELDDGSFIEGRSITAIFVPQGSGNVIPAGASVSGAKAQEANNPR